MNRMGQVAKLLGVELGEKFNIKGVYSNPFILDCNGLINYATRVVCTHTLNNLLIGKLVIEREPFKPKTGDDYCFVNDEGEIVETVWLDMACDYYYYNAKNCFKTRKEITKEDIERIVREMKGDYENEL